MAPIVPVPIIILDEPVGYGAIEAGAVGVNMLWAAEPVQVALGERAIRSIADDLGQHRGVGHNHGRRGAAVTEG